MNNIKLALLNIKQNIKNEKELKSSFITSIIGMAINNIAFLFLWYNFGTAIGEVNGWTAMDIFGLYGFGTTSFGIVTAFFYGIFNLPNYISSGTFDKYLLTPKNILLKLSTSALLTSAFGDLLFGIICFIIFAINYKFTLFQLFISFILVIVSSIIYYAFSLICMTISFYLMDGHNVSNGLYGMFLSNSLYHGGAFTGVLRMIFIYIIPSLLLGAVPVEIIKNFSIINLILIITFSILWLVIAVTFFNKSLKKYESNNLFGFGN